MKYALLLSCLLLISTAAYAQRRGEGIYAAPGMSVKLQPPTRPTPTRRLPSANKSRAGAASSSPTLPRFWHQTDTARSRAERQVHYFANTRTNYPSNTLRAGIDGLVYIRLTVAADGTVSQTEITRRDLREEGGEAAYSEEGKAALDAEVLRVMQALRFQPSRADGDTVTIMQRFVMQ